MPERERDNFLTKAGITMAIVGSILLNCEKYLPEQYKFVAPAGAALALVGALAIAAGLVSS